MSKLVVFKKQRKVFTARQQSNENNVPPAQLRGTPLTRLADQVVLLTQNIEDSFEAKKKAGAVFVILTAAYDTVWHCGLTCKLQKLLPDKYMVKMIMELKNGVPQGSVLARLLFNIYMYDLPSMFSRKFAYVDDLALLHSSGN